MRAPSELEIIKGNIAFVLQEKLPIIARGGTDDIDGEALLDVCLNYRKLAICGLLSDADTDCYYHQLYKSGRAYLHLLLLCQNGQVRDPYYLCTSKAEPFFDALAANDLDTGGKIASLASETWAEDDEDEDDFCYLLFLMKLLTATENSHDQLESILERFENALRGADPNRFNICCALYERNLQDFNSGMEQLILNREEEIKRERDGGLPSDPDFLETEAHVYVEGVALVRLAKLRGMEMDVEYKYVPSLAWVPMKSPFPSPNSWKSIEAR